jgi:hypothetical protein
MRSRLAATATSAALAASVISLGSAPALAGKAHGPHGNAGTVKVAEATAPCSFAIEWYGFDEGADLVSEVRIEGAAPTAGARIDVTGSTRVFVGGDAADGATDLDAREAYTLSFTGTPHPSQGFHVRVSADTPGASAASARTRTFWVQPCAADTEPAVPAVPTEPTDPSEPAESGLPATDPADPDGPTEPTEPTGPTQTTEPTGAADPGPADHVSTGPGPAAPAPVIAVASPTPRSTGGYVRPRIIGFRSGFLTVTRGTVPRADRVAVVADHASTLRAQRLVRGTWRTTRLVPIATDGSARVDFPRLTKRRVYKFRVVVDGIASKTLTIIVR